MCLTPSTARPDSALTRITTIPFNGFEGVLSTYFAPFMPVMIYPSDAVTTQ
jgi:hypothetical protein